MKLVGELLTVLFTVTTATMNDVMPDIQSDPPLSLRATLRKFSRTRHHVANPRGKEKARKYIKKVFTESGLHVWLEYIDSTPSLRGENIVGMLAGKYTGTAKDKIVIVGAHYDTTTRTRGVDDNGSGVTALLQVAKKIGKGYIRFQRIHLTCVTCKKCASTVRYNTSCVFYPGNSGRRFKHTVLFVAFDFEEDTAESEHPIPFGSQYFVRNLTKHIKKTRGKVRGALVLEMLANHNTTKGSQRFPEMFSHISTQAYHEVTLDGNRGNFLAVIGRKGTDQVLMKPLEKYYDHDKNFKIHLVPIPLTGRPSKSAYSPYLRDFYRSDHYNFWENSLSFPAVMVTDTSNFRAKMDKCYHRKCDNMRLIDKADLEFLRRNINAVIGATLELADMDSSHPENDHTVKAGLLISTKTAKTHSGKSEALKTENEQGRVTDTVIPTSDSKTASYSTLTALVTLIHCTYVARKL